MAGALEKFATTYNIRFVKEFYFLALVCDEKDLEYRMREGRKIYNEVWIQGSKDHNNYLRNYDSIDEVPYEKYDITGKSVTEVADYVDFWVKKHLEL